MRVPFFDLKSQYTLIQSEIDHAVRTVFDRSQFIGGDIVRQFEKHFAERLQAQNCVAVGNGTDALFIALKSLGIGPDTEVITPAWSWISSAETISLTGARPVFADVDGYFTIDPTDIERKMTPRTKAVIIVHLYGQMANVAALVDICHRRKISLIEDCAQAHFSSHRHQMAGTFGTMAAFSFYPTKNLGAYGDAGAIVTNDNELATQARRFANHGGLFKDDHQTEGMNSRMDSLQAAVLTAKLKYLDGWNERRIAHATTYMRLLANVGDLILPLTRKDTHHTFHQFVVRTKRRDELKLFLERQGIETMIHYPRALPFEPAYKNLKYTAKEFPVSAQLQNEVLSLPVYPELTSEQINFVCENIKQFFNA